MSPNPAGLYALCTIMPVLATGAVLARMRVRLLQKSRVQLDDWNAIAGLVSTQGCEAQRLYMFHP
jgi:hypothetical protein